MKLFTTALIAALLAAPVHALAPTFYEQPDVVGQDRLYDADKNMMMLQDRWVDGKIVPHYGFRMYTPISYDLSPLSGPGDLLPQPMYIASYDKTLEGIPEGQMPLLLNHHVNGTGDANKYYSDIMHIMFVIVPPDYVANTHRHGLELLNFSKVLHTTGIIVNMPLVPHQASLEHPYNRGEASPVQPWVAMAGDDESYHYVFETNSKEFADWINARTRPADLDKTKGLHAEWVPNFADVHSARVTPVYNMHGFGDGGMDLASKDRLDLGYGPIRRIESFSQLPPNYEPNQVRHNRDAVGEGFAADKLVIWWNTPQVGPYGGFEPTDAPSPVQTSIGLGDNRLRGMLWDHIDVPVTLVQNNQTIATTQTDANGVWEFMVNGGNIDPEAPIMVMQGGQTIATYQVGGESNEEVLRFAMIVTVIATAAVVVLLLLRKK